MSSPRKETPTTERHRKSIGNAVTPREALKNSEEPPMVTALLTYLSYAILIMFGHIRDFFGKIFKAAYYSSPKGYAPLVQDFDDFYTRRLYHRIQDCWNRPISSAANDWIDVMERKSKDTYGRDLKLTGETQHCLNLGSYNYLGFADGSCNKPVLQSLEKYGVSTCSTQAEAGNNTLMVELEEIVARYVGKPAAMICGMGFATNSTTLPVLIGKGGLIISDTLNHSSIVTGARASGAKVRTFKHNDPLDLEEVLRESIAEGQPRTHRPWRKIIVVIEGIYSMEGEICRLAEIVRVCKKLKAYVYLDEAHSIGALGETGRGCAEYCGVDTAEIDVMMGTFTKSFGSVGGYIAGSPELIQFLKTNSAASLYAETIAPPSCQQVISAFSVIMGEDGTNLGQKKLKALRDNANFFRKGLEDMGCQVYGNQDSPVIPVTLYNPAKIPAFSRECLKRDLAVVVVGFPATPLILSRVRFCVSAAHKKKDLEEALKKIDEVATLIRIKYAIQ